MPTRQPAEESLLLDLPFDEAPLDEAAPEERNTREIEQAALPLVPARKPAADRAPSRPAPATGGAAAPRPPLALRAAGGLIDLAACAAVMGLLLLALRVMGVSPQARDWPAGLLFLLAFSFLYQVPPLAFWGRTPGMTAVGTRSASRRGGPLTFRQAVLCWLASVLTVALAGLPLLLALGGRSLGDLMSGSLTRRLAR